MNEVIYLDVYFVTNFVMDLVSLLTAGLIASEKAKPLRVLLASALGAALSVSLLLLQTGPILTLILGFFFFVPMILTAFGKRSWRRTGAVALFAFLTSLFLGGLMEAIAYYTGTVGVTLGAFLAALFFSLGAFSLWGKGLKRRMDTSVISLSILHRGKEEQLYGLVDSGSLLRDPESGAPVILLKAEYAADLLSPAEMLHLRFGEGENVIPIPMRTASGKGCLYAFCPQAVRLHRAGKRRQRREEKGEVLVALDFTGGGFAGCPCLVPLSLV